MGELRPCKGCRRHVAVGETACPFCGVAREVSAPSTMRVGRMSRAAVFAGAALAATACGGNKPKTEEPIGNEQAATADAGVESADASPPVLERANPDIPMPYGAPPARRRVV